MLIIGVDTGGTFTDFIWRDGAERGEYKTPSTPADPAQAVLDGLRRIAKERAFDLVHGSTVATNTLLEKKGARTALITNAGFEDIIEIGRQNRPDLYALNPQRNPPLVPRRRRFGVHCRTDAAGATVAALSDAEIAALATELAAGDTESIAVCLLFSFLAPGPERRIRDGLAELGLPISLSHETLAEFREFERTSTTVINAYVSPKMRGYLNNLKQEIGANRLRIMQSNGGSIAATTAMNESVRTILSGPAGGAVGAHAIGRSAGYPRLITFDMGGTSTDVALIDGGLPLTMEAEIAGYPVKTPMIDIHTVGAGGGSLAMIDAGGALKVGPESAGADPGPVCYGRGEQLTVTDANLFLGRLAAKHFLGGAMALHAERLAAPFETLANELKLRPIELAEGILTVANIEMERAIKVISVERGHDPREFTLFSFGGAGGLHAAELARGLDIPRVLVPRNPGILSAYGMLLAPVIKDYSQTVMLAEAQTDSAELRTLFAPLVERGRCELGAEGVTAEDVRLEFALDMRYQGQSFEIVTPCDLNTAEALRHPFDRLHEKTYGYAAPDKAVEIVNLRLRAIGTPPDEHASELPTGTEHPVDAALLDRQPAIFTGQSHTTPIIDRNRLLAGNRIVGPAIIVEYSATTVIPPFATARVDRFGNLLIDVEEER